MQSITQAARYAAIFTPKTGGKGANMPEITVAAQEGENQENQPAGGSFEAITTQEQLNSIVKGRVARAEASTRKAYEDKHADVLEKAKKYDEWQEANKSELQKATERADKAEKELEQLKHERERAKWASEIAEKHGVPANLIQGDTQEEMEAFAKENAHYFERDSVPSLNANGKTPDESGGYSSGDPIRELFNSK